MKKTVATICLLALCCVFGSCKKEVSLPVLVKSTVYAYNLFMDNTPEPVTLIIKGEFPSEKQAKGDFLGRIEVKESDGTKHAYQDLQYLWVDGMLLLHRDNPTEEISKGVLCWVDPENPETVFLADRNWREPNAKQEIVAYVDPSLSDAEARSIGTKINRIDSVHQSVFKSREDALAEFVADHENDPAFGGVDAQTLRHRYIVTVETAEATETVVSQLKEIPGVAEVKATGWAPESIRILGPESDNEKMQTAFYELPKFPQ